MHLRFLLLLVVVLYFLWGLFLYVYQRDFMYLPVEGPAHTYPVEQFRSEGETIEVVVLNPDRPDAVMYFGGNAEAVVANAPGLLHSLPQHTVYLVNYRGYAGSTGTPTEQALYADALNIHDAIRDRHRSIAVIGRSLGSGVATFLAAERPVSRLVLVTPFDSLLRLAQDLYPIYPVSLLLHDKYDSYSRVDRIDAPTLLVLAEHDAVIPRKYAERLRSAFPPGQAEAETLDGVGHNGLSARAGYYALLGRFLKGASKNRHSRAQAGLKHVVL
jgi:pimeloyl-ACP methyl ester carboxylesterase